MAAVFPRNTARSDDNHIDDIQKDEVVHIVIDIPSTRRRQGEERQIVHKSRSISRLSPVKALRLFITYTATLPLKSRYANKNGQEILPHKKNVEKQLKNKNKKKRKRQSKRLQKKT